MINPIPGTSALYPFPWTFVQANYPKHYLASCISEEQVQDGIVEILHQYQVDAIPIDAGGKSERGRAIRRAKMLGIDARPFMRGGSGSSIPSGHADLAGTLAPSGRSLYIEVKAPAWILPNGKVAKKAGEPTVEQLDFLLSKFERGAIVLVAYSVDDVLYCLSARLQANRDALLGRRP